MEVLRSGMLGGKRSRQAGTDQLLGQGGRAVLRQTGEESPAVESFLQIHFVC